MHRYIKKWCELRCWGANWRASSGTCMVAPSSWNQIILSSIFRKIVRNLHPLLSFDGTNIHVSVILFPYVMKDFLIATGARGENLNLEEPQITFKIHIEAILLSRSALFLQHVKKLFVTGRDGATHFLIGHHTL